MSPEKQRIAISEACGWKPGGSGKSWGDRQTFGIPPNGEEWHWQETPDYLNDLNAMHEAERRLVRNDSLCSVGSWPLYLYYLAFVTDEQHPIDATAAQRAEAFLRTLNKWEETTENKTK